MKCELEEILFLPGYFLRVFGIKQYIRLYSAIAMPAEKACNIMQYINKIILSGKSLTPGEMANQLRISERHFYNYLNYMKRLGAPIYYNRKQRRYEYREYGSFFIGFLKDDNEI